MLCCFKVRAEKLQRRGRASPTTSFTSRSTWATKATEGKAMRMLKSPPFCSTDSVLAQSGPMVGRGGMVHIKIGSTIDFAAGALYPPPSSTKHSATTTESVLKWVLMQLKALPWRTTVLMGLDANVKLGLPAGGPVLFLTG